MPAGALCTGHHPILERDRALGWTCVKCGRPYGGRTRADVEEQIAEHGFAVLAARVLSAGKPWKTAQETHRALGLDEGGGWSGERRRY